MLQNLQSVRSLKTKDSLSHLALSQNSGVLQAHLDNEQTEQREDCKISFSLKAEEGAVASKGPQNM